MDPTILGNGKPAMCEIEIDCSGYPEDLKSVEKPPKTLYVLGNSSALAPGLAIVGARKATPYGLACAQRFGRIAAQLGVPVISGGAIGCDQAAHKGALEEGGRTVVVMGCGADVVYPKRGKELFGKIVESGGAIVSERPWGSPPMKWAFRMRNRIIAGLSKAVLIVEAGLPSGTFSTADYALECGRDVLVVPGSIFSRESYGSNTLLRQGAYPIIDDSSFMEAMGRVFKANMVMENLFEDEDMIGGKAIEKETIRVLTASPSYADDLIGISGSNVIEVLKVLSSMETAGVVTRYPDGRFGVDPRML